MLEGDNKLPPIKIPSSSLPLAGSKRGRQRSGAADAGDEDTANELRSSVPEIAATVPSSLPSKKRSVLLPPLGFRPITLAERLSLLRQSSEETGPVVAESAAKKKRSVKEGDETEISEEFSLMKLKK